MSKEDNKKILENPEYLLIDVKFDKLKQVVRYKSFYKTHEVDELVVVKSPADYVNRLGKYQVGTIVWVDEEPHTDIENKDDIIIQKVNFTGYNRYNRQVEELLEKVIDVDEKWNELTEEQKKELLKIESESIDRLLGIEGVEK